METSTVELTRPRTGLFARQAGMAMAVLSAIGMIAGLLVVETLTDDARATVSVSKAALEAIGDTVATVDDVAADTSASVAAASDSVAEVSATVDQAVITIEGVAAFLEDELPAALETIESSMPAAIQTANTIDGTLRALSLFGADYAPDEPFGDSLSRVSTALETLPDELREQSQGLRELIPSTSRLAGESARLSASMDDLETSLDGFTSLTTQYESTLTEAEATIEATDKSLDSSIWIIRALVVGAGIFGIVAGAALVSLGGQANELAVLLAIDAARDEEPVV